MSWWNSTFLCWAGTFSSSRVAAKHGGLPLNSRRSPKCSTFHVRARPGPAAGEYSASHIPAPRHATSPQRCHACSHAPCIRAAASCEVCPPVQLHTFCQYWCRSHYWHGATSTSRTKDAYAGYQHPDHELCGSGHPSCCMARLWGASLMERGRCASA